MSFRDMIALLPHRSGVFLGLRMAQEVLPIFETPCPEDRRPRGTLELVSGFLSGHPVRLEDLHVAESEAWLAGHNAIPEAHAVFAARASSYAAVAAYYAEAYLAHRDDRTGIDDRALGSWQSATFDPAEGRDAAAVADLVVAASTCVASLQQSVGLNNALEHSRMLRRSLSTEGHWYRRWALFCRAALPIAQTESDDVNWQTDDLMPLGQ